jgi:predicted nucleic acid-binding protein
MDALHVASAIAWKADLFVTSDKRQFQAAKKAKLKCRLV